MRAVLQRVRRARVLVGEEVLGSIDAGIAVLVGIGKGDHARDAELLAGKVAVLRIFDDEAGHTLSLIGNRNTARPLWRAWLFRGAPPATARRQISS